MKTTLFFIWLTTTSIIAYACGGKESADAPPRSPVVQSDAEQTPIATEVEHIVPASPTAKPAASTSSASCNRDLGETECQRVGGDFGPHGKAQMHFCICPAADSGKQCTDNSACEGYCECRGPDDTEGRCSARIDGFGCVCKMNNGKPVRICKD